MELNRKKFFLLSCVIVALTTFWFCSQANVEIKGASSVNMFRPEVAIEEGRQESLSKVLSEARTIIQEESRMPNNFQIDNTFIADFTKKKVPRFQKAKHDGKESKAAKSYGGTPEEDDKEYDFRPEVKFFRGSDDVESVNFTLHFFSQLQNAYSTLCEKKDTPVALHCSTFDAFVNQLKSTQSTMKEVKLHVIPLDPLAWLWAIPETKNIADDLTEKLVSGFDNAEPYMRYKGSDHIFLCLTSTCTEFASDFVIKLSNGQGTRAIFAGVQAKSENLKWPCPYRIIDLEQEDKQTIDRTVAGLIAKASYMIKEGNRWICADKLHPENYWYVQNRSARASGTVMKEYGFLMCSIPKCGSTMIKMLLRRMMHIKGWREIGHGAVHSPSKNGLKSTNPAKNFALTKAIFEDPSFIKAAVVRNPAARLLSGYLDKIVRKKNYARLPGLKHVADAKGRIPTFSEFVHVLLTKNPNHLDQHFKAQANFCGLRHVKFDFLGELEHMGEDFIEFAKSMRFWNKYGANGWGENHTDPFVHASAYRYEAHHSENQIWEYYSEDLLRKVYKYYKEDFMLLGYSLDALLATKPSKQAK